MDIKKLSDLDWLDNHWFYHYGNNGTVGEYLFEERQGSSSRHVREIIKEMRDYQTKRMADNEEPKPPC